MQPSLILAMLSVATFWQSSEIGLGRQGRERALRFRDEAQAAMDASFNSGWIDETLAQAAWVSFLFFPVISELNLHIAACLVRNQRTSLPF